VANALVRRNRRIDALVRERASLRVAKGILQLEKGELEAVVREVTRELVHPAAPYPPSNPAGYVPSSVAGEGQAYREYLTGEIRAGRVGGAAGGGEFVQVCAGEAGAGGGFGPDWTVVDVRDWPAEGAGVGGGRFALALCNAVLEHVPDPQRVVDGLFAALAPGGFVYLETGFWQPYRADPGERARLGGDFWRATVDGLRIWAAAFEELSSGWADEGVVYFFGRKGEAARRG
jgi:SAM-dependent methyltransferase